MTCSMAPSLQMLHPRPGLPRRGWGVAWSSGRKKCQLQWDIVKATPAQVSVLKKVPVCCFQALYDHLMDFLADRGVDNTFADELIELSTALEHQEYIKFLEDLKSFVKCQ